MDVALAVSVPEPKPMALGMLRVDFSFGIGASGIHGSHMWRRGGREGRGRRVEGPSLEGRWALEVSAPKSMAALGTLRVDFRFGIDAVGSALRLSHTQCRAAPTPHITIAQPQDV